MRYEQVSGKKTHFPGLTLAASVVGVPRAVPGRTGTGGGLFLLP
jgi:hypothetical protein